MDTDTRVEIDFLLLADRAEAINGKLYALGAAWDRIGVNDFTKPLNISVALGVLVPWNSTNQNHKVTLTLRDADGNLIDFRIDATFIAGRPAFLNGETQRVLLAVPAASVILPGPGTYALTASINDIDIKVVRFSAVAGLST